jgi:hypothetical protein
MIDFAVSREAYNRQELSDIGLDDLNSTPPTSSPELEIVEFWTPYFAPDASLIR